MPHPDTDHDDLLADDACDIAAFDTFDADPFAALAADGAALRDEMEIAPCEMEEDEEILIAALQEMINTVLRDLQDGREDAFAQFGGGQDIADLVDAETSPQPSVIIAALTGRGESPCGGPVRLLDEDDFTHAEMHHALSPQQEQFLKDIIRSCLNSWWALEDAEG